MIEIQWKPSTRFLRQFAGLFVLFFGALGALRLAGGDRSAAVVLWAVGAVGLLGLLVPRFMRFVYLGWMLLVFPIGWLVSTTLLILVFALIVTPLGLLMSALGRDPLRLRPQPEATSYWIARGPARPPASYFKQF